nr:biotin/lipoate--protein ligase family protein [Oceaniglobus trochenteri]
MPPLFTPLASAGADPFAVAVSEARAGCDAGLVVHDIAPDRLRAAVVFAPEVALEGAVVMLPLCGIGFQNALGALAPPEVGVHLDWNGGIRLNGGLCGALSMAAGAGAPVPDWLVVGLTLDLWSPEQETGHAPDITSLAEEGCGGIDPATLLSAWLRHTLVWLDTWESEGTAPLLREWTGLAQGIGADTIVGGRRGVFLGVDEHFGLLLKRDGGTDLVPLATLLKETP